MDILDILLLPKNIYRKMTDKKLSLYIGIILVGIIDMSVFLIEDFSRLFMGKAPVILFYNITLAILYVVAIGFMDVLFLSVPLFDLFKFFKRDKTVHNSSTLIKFMKTYIVANFVILPISVLFYVIIKNMTPEGVNSINSVVILFYTTLLYLIPSVWLSAAITRGVNAIYNFERKYHRLIFITIFTWSYILSDVFMFLISRWAMTLFR